MNNATKVDPYTAGKIDEIFRWYEARDIAREAVPLAQLRLTLELGRERTLAGLRTYLEDIHE